MSDGETSRVLNNPANAHGISAASSCLRASDTCALMFSEENKGKIGCAESCERPLKLVLCTDKFI